MDLELSPVDEMIVMDNMEVFRANGFDFTVDEDAAPTQRLKLSAYPFSKNTEFGIQDVHEMIEQLKEQPGKMVRLSRVSAMFASRACRKSVMVGTPLNTEQMRKVR
jgi:DNA mismatch repair protein PMS2